MKKISFFLFILCLFISNLSSQARFVKSYNYVSLYNSITGNWSTFQKSHNSFAFNINENGDFALYSADESKETFKSISDVKEMYTDGGEKYQLMKFLNSDGEEIILQLFEFGDTKLIYPEGNMVQFTNDYR